MTILVQWHNMGTSRCRRYRSLSTAMMLLLMLLLGTRNKWTHGAEEEQVCAATSNGEASESCKAAGGSVAASAIDTDSATRITGVNSDDNSAQDLKEEPPCTDDNEKCEPWADQGECKANPGYMNESCRRACRICKDPNAVDEPGEHEHDMGAVQVASAVGLEHVTQAQFDTIMTATEIYMKEKVIGVMHKGLVAMCKNEHEQCAIWAATGECDKNVAFMKKSCAPVCQSCDYLTVEGRCPLDPNAIDAWGPGDLNKMFEKLTSEPYLSEYDVQIHSSPNMEHRWGSPWVITMENIATEEEALRLIELGALEGYQRSAAVGPLKPDGTHDRMVEESRTSTNAWCRGPCYEDPIGQRVMQRLANLTGIPAPNTENLQLLRYEEGQFYKTHHDYIEHHIKRRQGVRILTVYLYLNDVPAGGGTNFDILDITVMPKRGRALIWPSVEDENPNMKDPRTTHQDLPVEEGVKYGANGWFHQRDFQTTNRERCQ